MFPVPNIGKIVAASDSTIPNTSDFFSKDGRKIAVGDCALFKPNQESAAPFIGIIRCLTSEEGNLKLGVNWLYRPADIKLAKGVLLEAAPNEIFYSFHKDEIPAASLLHPCKVAFLRIGVELPSGISSFVCRRVYDITNKRLWWLTDQDYINDRQEEVNKLLDKTRLEMHATQSGGRSPKTLSVSASTAQFKPGSDCVQTSPTTLATQGKGKKRERGDQGAELVKRERFSKEDDGDLCQFRLESVLKSEISKITDKGGLVDYEGVEKLVQLMQPDSTEKKIELSGRRMLVDVIGATERDDCLGRFVQLRGLSVLDEWLQEVHKGKVGDGSGPKESDKPVEDFLLSLLRALDMLPVNLHALQTCNVGKSVNNLRSHKNLEIQKKSRSLVDTWKKRVEAEMKMNDTKSGSNQAASWPGKQCTSEGSPGANRRSVGSEGFTKNSASQHSVSKIVSVKPGLGDTAVKTTSSSPGLVKLSAPQPAVLATSKHSYCKVTGNNGSPDALLVTMKEEKSSGSSQSQNNSQSCSSDHAKVVCGTSSKEEARSSTAGSINGSKTNSAASRHRKYGSSLPSSVISGVQRENSLNKCGSAKKTSTTERASQSGLIYERTPDVPTDHGNSHRLIVRLPNPGRSPARSASVCSFDDASATVSRASSPGHSEKQDKCDRKVKKKVDASRANIATDVNPESSQVNDVKDGVTESDAANGSRDGFLGEKRCNSGDGLEKLSEASKGTCFPAENDEVVARQRKLNEASLSSMNALVDSCVKASASMSDGDTLKRNSAGDDVGINLLASVATGEMSKSELVSPINSPRRSLSVSKVSKMVSHAKVKLSCEDVEGQDLAEEGTTDKHSLSGSLRVKNEIQHNGTISKSEEKARGDQSPSSHMQRNANLCLKSDVKPDEKVSASVAISVADVKIEGAEPEGSKELHQRQTSVPSFKKEIADGNITDKITSSSGLSPKGDKEAVKKSLLQPINMGIESKPLVPEETNTGNQTEQKQTSAVPSTLLDHDKPVDRNLADAVVSSCSGVILKDASNKLNSENERAEQTSAVPLTLSERAAATVSSVELGRSCGTGENSDRKVAGSKTGGSIPPEQLALVSEQESEGCVKSCRSKLSGVGADEVEECASTTGGSSLSAAAESDTAAKLDFDLNEGFPVDEANHGDGVNFSAIGRSSVIHEPSPLQFRLSSISSSVPASVTVTAAAKGPFVPPENLLRGKGEIGWKGSAATSAFRRAEPRKVPEFSPSSTTISRDAVIRQDTRLLDIDLNVADEMVEDSPFESSAHETRADSRILKNCELGLSEKINSSAPVSFTGLDLDLNRVDEDIDNSQFSANTCMRMEAPLLPVRSSSGPSSNGEMNARRNFDLNGPGTDELSAESTVIRHHMKGSLPFVPPGAGQRMNNAEMNLSSWFPIGNSYPALAIPSVLPDRGEQHYPIVSAAGAQMILGPSTSGPNYGHDMYRGPVLSSSPAVAYPPGTAYPYPGFPFGTAFSLPSTSFSGGSATSGGGGGGLCFPAGVPSQLLGPVGHYPRPYMILQDGATLNGGVGNGATLNGGVGNGRKMGRQGLDLNAGPGTADAEGREERYNPTSRQHPVASSHTSSEEQGRMMSQTAAVSKRKEPDGGWDMERFGYKQPWQ